MISAGLILGDILVLRFGKRFGTQVVEDGTTIRYCIWRSGSPGEARS